MKYAILIFTFISMNLDVFSSELEARAVYRLYGDTLEVAHDDHGKPIKAPSGAAYRPNLVVWLFLTNHTNEQLQLPTENLAKLEIEKSTGILEIQLMADWVGNPLNIKAIVPESAWGVVTLRNGETFVLKREYYFSDPKKCSGVKVSYAVKEEIARRYGFWSGHLEVDASDNLKIKDDPK